MFHSIKSLIISADEWLAAHPHAITSGATIAATLLARFGFNADGTEIAIVASAVVAAIAAIASGSNARYLRRALKRL